MRIELSLVRPYDTLQKVTLTQSLAQLQWNLVIKSKLNIQINIILKSCFNVSDFDTIIGFRDNQEMQLSN